MTSTYPCVHHGATETTDGEISYRYCGCDGTVHLACSPVPAPEGTPRPDGWPIYLPWRTQADGPPMTYDQALARLTGEFGNPDLVARNLLQTAFKGASAWFGGSQSPYRLVQDRGATRDTGYRILSDGFVILEPTED